MTTYLMSLVRRFPRNFALTLVLVLSTLGLLQALGRDWPLAAGVCALGMVASLSALSIRTESDR